MSISPIRPGLTIPAVADAVPGKAGSSAFASMFKEAVARVDGFQHDASRQVERFLAGETEDIHATAMAVQRAELTFELFQQVRSKVVQAYQEIMRQQL